MKLSSYVNIPPSATIAMNALAAEKKQKGERVFNLTVGEPMVESSHFIFEAAVQAMNDGKTFYPPAAGIPELRSEVATWVNTQFQSNFGKENVLVSCGAKHGLLMTLQSLLEMVDEVLVVAPYWVSYPPMTTLAGGKPVILETSFEKGWKLHPEKIQSAVTPQTKVLILNNGGNPTGILYSKEEIRAILEICKKNNIVVISDEVYSGLTFDENEFVSVASFPEYAENTIVVQSASKHFAMTGWRVGFVVGPKNLISALETLQSQSTTGTSSISQWATLGALQHADEIIPNIKREIQSRRDAFVQNFEQCFGVKIAVPACGLYAFIPLSSFGVSETDSVKFCMEVLEKANVVFVPGAPFGAEGFVRASFGGKVEDVAEGLKKLSEYVNSSKI